MTVHPHVCGEYITIGCNPRAIRGSSPRVWGIPDKTFTFKIFLRFIPTCVGNTQKVLHHQVLKNGSSPRVWGIRNQMGQQHSPENGSSPRVWGIRLFYHVKYPYIRFIPTCVGNTKACFPNKRATAVHPHVCGEYLSETDSQKACWRFIPTCVGNTQQPFSKPKKTPGSSPRVWGILAKEVAAMVGEYGSSPRVWGIRMLCVYRHGQQRFIPTCVGNTTRCSTNMDG